MVFVNKIDIKKNEVQSCSDSEKCFVLRIQQEADEYHEVSVFSDRYEKVSENHYENQSKQECVSSVQNH